MSNLTSSHSWAVLLSCGLLIARIPSRADEGMWTFDNPPIMFRNHFSPRRDW
jgi:hypothetical protein